LLEEPCDRWFRQQLCDCLKECAREKRKEYEQRFVSPTIAESQPPVVANIELPVQREWKDLEIAFTSDERIQIDVGGRIETRNFEEMGFASKKNGLPVLAWHTLRQFAESGGVIGSTRDARTWAAMEKRIQEIRKVLRDHFGLSDDPFEFLKKSRRN